MLGTSSSRKAVRPRRIRLLAWPRSPRRIMWCFERMALTICGITVSSYPTMPGKSGSFAFNIRSRFSRISSRTVLRAVRASVKWLRMRAPRVVGLFIRFSFAMISPYLQTQVGSGMVQSSLRVSPCQRLADAGGGDGRRCDRAVPAKSAARDPDRGAQAGRGRTQGGGRRRRGADSAAPRPRGVGGLNGYHDAHVCAAEGVEVRAGSDSARGREDRPRGPV